MAYESSLSVEPPKVENEIERLKLNIALTRGRLNETLGVLTEKLRPANLIEENVKRPLQEKFHELSTVANERLGQSLTFVGEQAQVRPLTLGAVALGLGVVTGLFLTRNSSRRDEVPPSFADGKDDTVEPEFSV